MSGSQEHLILANPEGLHCEAPIPLKGTTMKVVCPGKATTIYGPECERESGKLMYLCDAHATGIRLWADAHPNEPVICPEHGIVGKVKDYMVLKRMDKA